MPSVAHIGEFRRDDRFDDWWHSPELTIPCFDEKRMPVSVINLKEVNFVNGNFPAEVSAAIHAFLKLGKSDRIEANPLVYENYLENREYCRFLPWMLLGASQVWRYVQPTFIRIEKSYKDSLFYVVVTFDCDWEEEHGMRMVYQEGSKLTRVSADDGRLHDYQPPT